MAAATACFFFLMFGYYLLRPMREAFGIARGADKLPWLMTATLAAMALAGPAFAALVSRMPRRRFIPVTYRFFIANLALFLAGFALLPGHGGAVLGYAFYVWLSVFNLFAVSVFWAFMADGLDADQGRRLFAFIALGGTLGAMGGAGATAWVTRQALFPYHPAQLLAAAALCLELAVRCAQVLILRLGMGPAAPAEAEPRPGILAGLALMRQPYLAGIALYMLLYTVLSTFLYLQQGQIVAASFSSQALRTAAFARIDLWVNGLSLVTQALLAGRILSRVSLRAVLAFMPAVTLAGFAALWAAPTFAVLAGFQVLRRGLHYAVDRPARETLYIPLGPDEKYKAKPFIDTFLYRVGDLVGTWSAVLLAALALPLGAASLVLSGGFIATALRLGTLHRRITAPGAQPR